MTPAAALITGRVIALGVATASIAYIFKVREARFQTQEGLRIQLGTTGRRHSMEYSWPRVTSQVLDVYHSVLGQGAARR